MTSGTQRSFSRVPVELWRLIFSYAVVSPSHFVTPPFFRDALPDLTYNDDYYSCTIQTKKCLPLVSLLWRDIGTEYLCREVEVFEISNLIRLVDILRQSQEDNRSDDRTPHGWWIRRLRLTVHVPDNWSKLYIRSLSHLFTLCPNLAVFIISPPPHIPNRRAPSAQCVLVPTEIIRALVDSCRDTLTSVSFGDNASLENRDLRHLCFKCSNLKWLRIGIVFPDSTQTATPEYLTETLTNFHLTHFAISHLPTTTWADRFFQVAGAQLTSLCWGLSKEALLKRIVVLCPNLESLALDFREIDEGIEPIPKQASVGKSVTRLWIFGFMKFITYVPSSPTIEKIKLSEITDSFANLQRLCFPDWTLDSIRAITRINELMRQVWFLCTSYLREKSILFIDKNGVELEVRFFEEEEVDEDEDDGSDFVYESPEDSTDGSNVDLWWGPWSEDEEVDTDYAREVRRSLAEPSHQPYISSDSDVESVESEEHGDQEWDSNEEAQDTNL